MSGSKSVLDAVLAQYEKNKKGFSSGSTGGGADLTKYFSTFMPKGQSTGNKTFRILPPKEGESPFVEAHWHSIQVDGKWLKLYCPKNNDGGECPLCNVEEALKLTGTEANKKLARNFRSKTFYVLKGIDRDKPEEGVKFWRFPHNFKGEGVIDKIIPLIQKRGEIWNTEEGRDLYISLGRDDKGYTKIMSIMTEDTSPLHEDKNTAEEWLANDMTFKNVYKSKTVDYLDIVARGGTPVWDKGQAKYVDDNEPEDTGFGDLDIDKEINTTNDDSVGFGGGTPSGGQTDDLPF